MIFKNITIRQKIGLGYALVLGISLIGITMGQSVGQYYENQARIELELSYEEDELLHEFKIALLKLDKRENQLLSVNNQQKLDIHHDKTSEIVKDIKTVMEELDLYIKNNQTKDEDIKELTEWWQVAKPKINIYIEEVTKLLPEKNVDNFNDKKLEEMREKILNFIQSNLSKNIDIIDDKLTDLIEDTHKEKIIINSKFKQTQKIHSYIVYSSLLLSIVTAIALALYISRVIAKPIENATQVVNKVIENNDFTLQIPIKTQDEIGVLSQTFNHLITEIADYTDKLENARQNLEARVRERTAELQATLENLHQTQSQLIQTEKMSSLGQMVAGVAHEINNPVNFIYGNIEHIDNYIKDLINLINLYEKYYPETETEIHELIEDIELDFIREDLPKIINSMQLGTDRIRAIVLSLRNFSRLDEAEIKLSDIHEGIDSTLLLLNHRLKLGINVIKNYGNLPLIECYPAQLNQVFMNIISNGIDAIIEQEDYQNKQIIITTEKRNNEQIIVKIADNGTGIPDEIKSKLFDPFFTTKPVGKGIGLGLSIVYQIITKHHGQIEVNSSVGKGTQFEIILPMKFPNK